MTNRNAKEQKEYYKCHPDVYNRHKEKVKKAYRNKKIERCFTWLFKTTMTEQEKYRSVN